MPTPNAGETEQEFLDRCIPQVLGEGTTTDPSQAAAICHSKWDGANKSSYADVVAQKYKQQYSVKSSFSGQASIKDVDFSKRIVTGFFNTYNVLDSQGDVLVMGAAKRSIAEHGPDSQSPAKIVHALHHDLTRLPGRIITLKETTMKTYTQGSMGEAMTGIYFETKMTDTTDGRDTLINYQEQVYNNHSIGFQYKNVSAVERDSEAWAKETANIINKDALDGLPVIYVVKEIALWEGSTVAIGSNQLTPYLGVKSQDPKLLLFALKTRMDTLTSSLKSGRQSDEMMHRIELQAMQIKQMLDEISELTYTNPREQAIKETGVQKNSLQYSDIIRNIAKNYK